MDSRVAVTTEVEEVAKLPGWMDAAETYESVRHVKYMKRIFPVLEANLQ